MNIDIKQLKLLMRALRRYDFAEIELRQGDEEIVLRRGRGGSGPSSSVPFDAFPLATAARGAGTHPDLTSLAPPAIPTDDPNTHLVTSPLVGTFYGAPSPNAKNFVEVGAAVKPGTVLCIVEAMKLMNEIECDVTGTVVEVLAQNGKPVEYGEKLFKIKTAG